GAAAATRWASPGCRGAARLPDRGPPPRRASRRPRPPTGRTSRLLEATAKLAHRLRHARSGAPEQLARQEQEPLGPDRAHHPPFGTCRIARWHGAVRQDGDELGIARGDRLDRDLSRGRGDVMEHVARPRERGESVEVAPGADYDRGV